MNLRIVVRVTCNFCARERLLLPFLRSRLIYALFPDSLYLRGFCPFLRPICFPSFFARSSPCFVRSESKVRSTSAHNPNANASTRLCILSPSSNPSLIAITVTCRLSKSSRTSRIIRKLLPKRDSSVTIIVSSFVATFNKLPSCRFSIFFVPLIVSAIHTTLCRRCALQYCRIASC